MKRLLIVATAVLLIGGIALAQQGGAGGSGWFEDVPEGHYAEEAIEWAVRHGITQGISADKFGPDQTVTRAQIVVFLHRTAELARQQAKFTFVDIPHPRRPGYTQDSHDGWSCGQLGSYAPFSLQCAGDLPAGYDVQRLSVGDLSVGSRMGCAVSVVAFEEMHQDYYSRSTGVGPLECWGTRFPDGLDQNPESRFFAVAVGSVSWLESQTHQVCAIRYDPDVSPTGAAPGGRLECWGDIEVDASISNDWLEVTVGEKHVCAIHEVEFDGAGYIECWGDNTYYQTEDPIGIFESIRSRHDLNYTCAIYTYDEEWECWGQGNPVPKP